MKKKDKKRIKKALIWIVESGLTTPTEKIEAARLIAEYF